MLFSCKAEQGAINIFVKCTSNPLFLARSKKLGRCTELENLKHAYLAIERFVNYRIPLFLAPGSKFMAHAPASFSEYSLTQLNLTIV